LNLESLLVLTLGVFATYFLGLSTYSFFISLILIPIILSTVNTLTYRKIRTKIRDDEETAFGQSEATMESTQWINSILQKAWVNNRWYAARLMKEKVEPILKESKPGFLKDITLHSVDLGVKTPQLSNFIVHRLDEQNRLTFDCDFDWDSDFNIKVRLDTTAFISADVVISHLEVNAKVRIIAYLLPNTPPFASLIHIQLREQPHIDIEVKPLGGASFDITNTVGIKSLIDMAIANVVEKMFIAPKYTEVDLVKIMNNEPGAVVDKKDETGVIASSGNPVTRGIGAVGDVGVGAVKGLGKGVSAVGNFGMKSVKGFGKGVTSLGKSKEHQEIPDADTSVEPSLTQ
jgi:Ca2+-dependent lipid-binding protein